MIPSGAAVIEDDAEEVQEPSRTYRLDIVNGYVAGMIDGLEAVKQFVLKTLLTERFGYFIYSFDYGAELQAIVGSPQAFIRSELPRLISEALRQDDRIIDINDFQLSVHGDSAVVSFTVVSIYGSYREEIKRRV